MTCIVGLVAGGRILMGADSFGVRPGDWSSRSRLDAKCFRRDEYLIGFSGSFRAVQLLQYRMTLPRTPADSRDLHEFVVTEFVEALRAALKEGGAATLREGVESSGSTSFLVGVRGRLFEIESDYQVGENDGGVAAIGSGSDVALGSLATSGALEVEPEKRVSLALSAAERFNCGVRAPFKIFSLEPWVSSAQAAERVVARLAD